MKSLLLTFAIAVGALSFSQAQERYFTKAGVIIFDAEGPLDDLEQVYAKNTAANCVIDAASGQMEWAVLIKGFHFKNALMEEHFNENYLESTKFPKASFKGSIENPGAINWKQDGVYPVKVKGKMTIHGITKDMNTSGNITVKNKQITATSSFEIALADYDIKVPAVVGNKIGKVAKVTLNTALEPFK